MKNNKNELTEIVDLALFGKNCQMSKRASIAGPAVAGPILGLFGLGVLSSFLSGMADIVRLISGAIGKSGETGSRAAQNVGSFIGRRLGWLLSDPEYPDEYYYYPRVLAEYELAKSKLKNRLERYQKQIFEDVARDIERGRR